MWWLNKLHVKYKNFLWFGKQRIIFRILKCLNKSWWMLLLFSALFIIVDSVVNVVIWLITLFFRLLSANEISLKFKSWISYINLKRFEIFIWAMNSGRVCFVTSAWFIWCRISLTTDHQLWLNKRRRFWEK